MFVKLLELKSSVEDKVNKVIVISPNVVCIPWKLLLLTHKKKWLKRSRFSSANHVLMVCNQSSEIQLTKAFRGS